MQITIEKTVISLHRSVASLEGHNLIHTRAHHCIEMLGKIEEKLVKLTFVRVWAKSCRRHRRHQIPNWYKWYCWSRSFLKATIWSISISLALELTWGMSLPCTVCHFPSLHPSRRAIVKLPVPCTQQNSGEKKEEMAALTVSYSTLCYTGAITRPRYLQEWHKRYEFCSQFCSVSA